MRPAVQQPISKDKNVMVQTREYYLKNHYLTFMSKVKVPGRSLWYTTHRLMVMHPHTKYHWPISKETIIWPWGQSPTKVIMVCNTPPYGHAPTYQISLTSLERNNYLTLRSKSNKVHYGMQHTTLWTCTHIPNIIDLSRKKQLFDLEVKCQGPNKGLYGTWHTSYGHAPTYQISLTNLERQKMLWPEQENTI